MTDASACTAADVVAEARSWVGVAYRHQGRNRSGVDCGGLIVMVGQNLGLMHAKQDMFGYPLQIDVPDVQRAMEAFFDRAPLQIGGVVLLRPPSIKTRWATHLGILSELPSGEPGLIHSYGGGQAKQVSFQGVVETRFNPWRKRVVRSYVYRGLG